MFRNKMGLGVDIGDEKIKIVQVQAGHRALRVTKFAEADTPPGAIERGSIVKPEDLGAAIADLADSMELGNRNAVAAVGQPIYTKVLVMPAMKREELRQAVLYQASAFLPVPVEEAAIDVIPLRAFPEQEAGMNEVFFVAVRRTQVELLEKICRQGGLLLKAVEIEPLALYRMLCENGTDRQKTVVIINISLNHASFSSFYGSTIRFYRDFSYDSVLLENKGLIPPTESIDDPDLVFAKQHKLWLNDFISEIQRFLEHLRKQDSETPITAIWLCGNQSLVSRVGAVIQERTGYLLEYPQPVDRIKWPGEVEKERENQVFAEYMLALGLAARGLA